MSNIQMTATLNLLGDNGNYSIFIFQLQYEFFSKRYKTITALDAEKYLLGRSEIHYEVKVGDESFWVPSTYCVEYDVPYKPISDTDDITNKANHEYLKYSNDSAKDVYAQYKEVTGRTIDNTYRIERSARYRNLLGSNNLEINEDIQ